MHFIQCCWDKEVTDMLKRAGNKVTVLAGEYDFKYYADEMAEVRVDAILKVNSFNDLQEIMDLAGYLLCFREDMAVVNLGYEGAQFAAGILRSLLSPEQPALNFVQKFRNKLVMKNILGVEGIPLAKFCGLRDGYQDGIAEVTALLNFPIVVKPISGASARGVSVIKSTEEFMAWSLHSSSENAPRRFLAEEFVQGSEYHVDSVWFDGCPIYSFVGRYDKNCLDSALEGYTGSRYLRRSEMPEIYDRAISMVHKVGKILGMDVGITHGELFVTSTGEMIFGEIASRAGGGGINRAIKSLVGESLRELGARAVASFFAGAPIHTTEPDILGGFINLRPPIRGEIVSISSADQLRHIKGVVELKAHKKVGDTIGENVSTDWCLLANVEGGSPKEINKSREELRCRFKIAVK